MSRLQSMIVAVAVLILVALAGLMAWFGLWWALLALVVWVIVCLAVWRVIPWANLVTTIRDFEASTWGRISAPLRRSIVSIFSVWAVLTFISWTSLTLIAGFWWALLATIVWAIVSLVGLVAWVVKSIGSVDSDEVAVPVWWGKPEKRRIKSGLTFVPWGFGIGFDGRTLCELVRVTTNQLHFNFRNLGGTGTEEQLIWSSDRIALLVDLTGWIRFPYEEEDSLCLMIESGVPLNDAARLSDWVRSEVISGLRDILAQYDHKEAMARSNLDAIRQAAQAFFLQPTGLFAKSGICGNNPTNSDPGTGEVIVRIDIVKPDEEMRKAMASPVISAYDAEAAKQQAKVSAALFDDTNQAFKAWLKDQQEAVKAKKRGAITRAEITAKQRELRDRALAKTPGYQQIDVRGLENAGTAVVGGGGGAGILVGNSGGGGGSGKGKNKNPNQGSGGGSGAKDFEDLME